MAADRHPIDAHWRTFAALREDVRIGRAVIGVDRGWSRLWVIRAGAGSSAIAFLAGWLLVLFCLISLAGIGVGAVYREYLLAGLFIALTFLTWKLFVRFSVTAARRAALRDESRFRRWFDERRISLYIKATREYVWNDRA